MERSHKAVTICSNNNNRVCFKVNSIRNFFFTVLYLFAICVDFTVILYRGKRPANSNTGSGNNVSAKRGRGSSGMSNQLVNKAFQGISSHGGGRGGNRRRGGGRGRGQGRGHW